MAAKFYPLRVKHIDRTTADCVVITLDVPVEWRELFRFQQGQHLTVRTAVDGQEVRRSYSLCSSPLEEAWKIAVKKVPEGLFSAYANEVLQAGDLLEVLPPNGRFYVPADPAQARQYVAFAAGSGITPILSILKTHLEVEPQSSFQLFYVNRTVASIMLREEIEALKNLFLDRLEVFHFLTREERSIPLFNGRITGEKLDLIFRTLTDAAAVDEFFICGPAEMIFLIRDYLLQQGVSAKNIHFELFNTAGLQKNGKTKGTDRTSPDSTVRIRIHEGGKTFSFQSTGVSRSILDAALQHNADLPFACKGGVCCTCKAKLLKGEVEMETNYALEQEQLDAGYILTCQAVPLSQEIVVDFDG